MESGADRCQNREVLRRDRAADREEEVGMCRAGERIGALLFSMKMFSLG